MMTRTAVQRDGYVSRFAGDPEFEEEAIFARAQANLGLSVNRLRHARGWSQEELATRAKMRQPRIAEIERGDANPQLETVSRLAAALGVEASELLATSVRTEPTRSAPVKSIVVTQRSRQSWDEAWQSGSSRATTPHLMTTR
jgi:HTH-type transcriptional regulator/antitoxin HipB